MVDGVWYFSIEMYFEIFLVVRRRKASLSLVRHIMIQDS
jgi:hypothetical protein